MNKVYKILWVDDQHKDEDMIPFIIDAEGEGLLLDGYTSFEEAFEVLEKHISIYDAILLDGLFFERKGQVAGTEDVFGIGMAIARINELKSKKLFPWFVLSGKDQFIKGKNSLLAANKVRCYDKTSPKDVVELFKAIKHEADQQVDTQIRHKYQRVFDVCNDKYIGGQGSTHLLSILKNENKENDFTNPDLYFVPLRKIMDDLFIACNKYGILPDVFVKPSVALNESSKFLSGGIEKGYQLDYSIFPKIISDNVRSILAVCQPAAHRAEIDRFIEQINSPYLLLSITYQLLDVLLWFKYYIDNNYDVEISKSKFKAVEAGLDLRFVSGPINQDVEGNYYCVDVILTRKHFNDNGYKIGDEIRIIKTSNNTNERTMHLYKKSAYQSEKK